MAEATTSSAIIDLTGDPVLRFPEAAPMPVGRAAQLRLLQQQLEWCDKAVRTAQREAGRTMRDGDVEEADRWRAVQRLRAIAWKVCREVLPLVGRVPAGLRQHPQFREVERIAHRLRRTTEDALRDNANYTVDLVVAADAEAARTVVTNPW